MEKVLKLLLSAVIILALISVYLTSTTKLAITPGTNLTNETGLVVAPTSITYSVVSMKVPAVDEEGNGVATTLMVESKQGTGRVLVDVNQLLFWVDTQDSIRTAQRVAQNVTELDLTNIDLVYAIETNASLIGGPSAGAALTVATIAALKNKTVNPYVMITGTINHDGTIGPVGEILAKAKAAKDIGAKTFLVPSGQSLQTYYTPVEHCEHIGPITYCAIEYKTEKINITKDAGIETKEVSDIEEALKYFLE